MSADDGREHRSARAPPLFTRRTDRLALDNAAGAAAGGVSHEPRRTDDRWLRRPITAKDVQELRQRTGAGMMDCKKALEETGGDMDKAVEYLRKKGIAKAEKRAGPRRVGRPHRRARQRRREDRRAVELNSRPTSSRATRSSARSRRRSRTQLFGDASFDGVVTCRRGRVHGAAVAQGRRQDRQRGGEGSVGQDRRERRAAPLCALHDRRRRSARTCTTTASVAVARRRRGRQRATRCSALAKTIAEHVAAGVPTVPLGVNREEVTTELVERERRIFEEQARTAGKPRSIIEKIVEGQSTSSTRRSRCSSSRGCATTPRRSGSCVDEASKEAGAPLTVRRFARFQMGEE